MSSPEPAGEAFDLIADETAETADLRAVAREILAFKDGEKIPPEVIQRAFTALSNIYSVEFQLGRRYSPFVNERALPPTVAMIMATAMLRAVKVELFELGMWQAWARP